MVRKLFFISAITLLTASISYAAEAQPTIQGTEEKKDEKQEKKDEKPKRNPVVDVFTRIDQGEGGVDALIVYAHPLYFAYKGIFEEAKKKYDTEKFHVFMITINSAKKADLSKFKIEASIFIITEDGLEYPAVPQWIPLSETPSKRTGVIRFFQVDAQGNKLLKDSAKSFEIVIKDLAGVPERKFNWGLPIEF